VIYSLFWGSGNLNSEQDKVIESSEGQQFTNIASPALTISPDGSQFVYGTTKGLYLRSVDALNARLIAGTDKDSTLPVPFHDKKFINALFRE
jgi:hypothetical protein